MISIDIKRRITIKCKKIITKIQWTIIRWQYHHPLISSDILTTPLFFIHSLFEKTLKYENRTKCWLKLEHFILACRYKGEQKISNNVFCAKEIPLCFYLNKINIIYKHIQQHKARPTRFIYTAARLDPTLPTTAYKYISFKKIFTRWNSTIISVVHQNMVKNLALWWSWIW